MGSPLLFSFWDDFGQDTHILLKMGQRGHGGWEWRLKFKSIFNLRKCSLAACLKCFTTKADLIVTQLLSAYNHRQQCHNRHRDDYMMIWYFFYLQQVWELLSFRGSVKDALLKLDIVYQEVIFLKGCIENLSAISLAECLRRKITLALGWVCFVMPLICDYVCVCVFCLFVCLLFAFCLIECLIDGQLYAGKPMLYNYQHSTRKENSSLNRQGDDNNVVQCTAINIEAPNSKQGKRQTTMAVDVN